MEYYYHAFEACLTCQVASREVGVRSRTVWCSCTDQAKSQPLLWPDAPNSSKARFRGAAFPAFLLFALLQ
jgi:hypothetical protein